MVPTNRQSLRIVVQHIWESPSGRSSYRLVAYADTQNYKTVEFESFNALLKVFKTALHSLDAGRFSREKENTTSIAFADYMELSEAQMATLGLTQ